MIDDILSFSASEVGYNHIKSDKVCEDASGYYDDELMHICVVADGHGSDNYPRTDRGSKMAVDAAIKCTKDFIKTSYSKDPDNSIIIDDILVDENKGFPILRQLAKSILMDWHESINEDYANNPFSEEELSKVSEKYKKRYLAENEDDRSIEKAYGCTLILYAVTDSYSFGFQIGDGKCVVIDQNGTFSEPIPWDDNCQLNVTTSICDSDSIDEFRFFITDTTPTAVFCGSDGIDDSYTNSEELYALYRSIIKIFVEHGTEVGQNEVKEYLPVLTKKGSGDDVSIGMMLDTIGAEHLLAIFDLQTKLFNLNEDLKEKKHQLNTNIEKDTSLGTRIRKWLDSGKKSNDSSIEDVYKVNELRGTREQIEEEIRALEAEIEVLETQLSAKIADTNDSDTNQEMYDASETDEIRNVPENSAEMDAHACDMDRGSDDSTNSFEESHNLESDEKNSDLDPTKEGAINEKEV